MKIACLVEFKQALNSFKTYSDPKPAGCEELQVLTVVPKPALRS
jgi:hypothetical protein